MISCSQNQDSSKKDNSGDNQKSTVVSKDSVVKDGNITTTFSTDIDKLGLLLDFKTYKPTKVKFRYVFIDNSGQDQRISIPGPSDYSLQALLYFDSMTFEKLLDYDRDTIYSPPNFDKEEFEFDWLDKEVKKELSGSKENYHGHPDFFFGTTNSKVWYLDRKILLSKWTN